MRARRTQARVLLVARVCVMLLSQAPATAGAWLERLSGTMGSMSPAVPTVRMQMPSPGDGHAVQGAYGGSLLLVLGGVLLGLLGLLLASRLPLRWHRRPRRRDIDRLTQDFQALFRKIDQGG